MVLVHAHMRRQLTTHLENPLLAHYAVPQAQKAEMVINLYGTVGWTTFRPFGKERAPNGFAIRKVAPRPSPLATRYTPTYSLHARVLLYDLSR